MANELIYRSVLADIEKWLPEPEIIVLLGARQVGKTSLLKMAAERAGDAPCFWFDLEDTRSRAVFGDTEALLARLRLDGLDLGRRSLLVVDEIQKLDHPSSLLKLLRDHHPYLKLMVSGSSSLEIRQKTDDALTGRKRVFEIHPLDFEEYLRFLGHEQRARNKSQLTWAAALVDLSPFSEAHVIHAEMALLFEEYTVYGGYPRVTLRSDREMRLATLDEIYNSYIAKDVRDLARVENVGKFNDLVEFLAVQAGGLYNASEISKEVGVARDTLANWQLILENTFVVQLLRPFHTNRQKELTKMPKLYFVDSGLRNRAVADFRPLAMRPDAGELAEHAVLAQLTRNAGPLEEIRFWRTTDKKEVDFVVRREGGNIVPIEVKCRHMTRPEIGAPLRAFIRQYSPSEAIIVNRDLVEEATYEGTRVIFLPLWMV